MPSKLTQSPAWQALAQHQRATAFDMRALFAADPQRFERCSIAHAGILLDYSKHWLTEETLSLLVQLAEARELRGWIGRLMAGERINATEDRPALHTALRATRPVRVNGHDVTQDVKRVHAQMRGFCDALRGGALRVLRAAPLQT